ncbi:hypothetical protein SY88_06060 [Clostridiales bacterium PH28_bin88]|nr:hypothetical protein SY88_06060 [Clostridiales bacterium PH28_bin88]
MSVSREELIKAVERLPEDKLKLLERYVKVLENQVQVGPKNQILENPAKRLRGLHKDIWRGVDVEQYVRQERDSWDS